ncbi:glycosyltransferase family 8 protein [Nocardioides sp.]|uniref:glycosyltransferase family 8 protein n=1 Tax=Nocardioides sp. TaxID=35761 RepID=UPI003561C270
MPDSPDQTLAATAAQAARRLVRGAGRALGDDASADEEADRGATSATEPAAEQPHESDPESDPGRQDAQLSRQANRHARVQWRLTQAVLGRDAVPESHLDFEVDPATLTRIAATAKRARAMAVFGDLVATGVDVRRAHAETVRSLCASGLRPVARAFLLGVEPGLVDGALLTELGQGLVLFSMAEYDLAWREFADVEPATLADLVPVEAVTCALADGSPAALAIARTLAGSAEAYDVTTLVELAGRFLSTGHEELARELVDEAAGRDADEVSERDALALRSLRRWTHPEAVAGPAPGQISLGVMDYHQPDFDRASRNVGDYVQTLAMLGNLARFRETTFTGADELGDLLGELQQRVLPELHLPGGRADVHLTPISRDFSSGDPVPEHTWMIAFGWHMHSTFRLGFGLPYHPNLHPVFVSFHINRVNVLTPETIDYLRAHGPIGCRDWTTVDLLLSAGVDAFFTGCLTTTVNAVFPPTETVDREGDGVVGAVDLPPAALRAIKAPTEVATHAGAEFREASLVSGTRAAIELLESYQRRYTRVVTSRLHSYLPATSLGLRAKFRPPFLGDVRFDGLLEMTPQKPEFAAIRDGIRELLARVHELILAGTAPADFYAEWRRLTADRVAEARARFEQPVVLEATGFDQAATTRRLREGAVRLGPHDTVDADRITDVAMSLDRNFLDRLPVTVESMLSNASGPVRLWVTARGLTDEDLRNFSALFPELPVTFLRFDDVDYGEITRMLGHISVATMDRLLLPEVLVDLDRITYLDIDTVTEGDVCELAATDLAGHPLAGRPGRQSGATLWRLAGDKLAPELASELRRSMSARHAFDFAALNAGVLVLDLARMRADEFVARFLPMAGRYGLNDQDILNAYAGADRVELEPRWNALPLIEHLADPGVIHYAGVGKPWDVELVPQGEHWQRYERQVAQRAEGLAR